MLKFDYMSFMKGLACKISLCAIMFVSLITCVSPASAIEFTPHNIISNYDATNYRDMSRTAIVKFLNKLQSPLTTYKAMTKEGKKLSASSIIHQAAKKYKMSKRFLLVMLQREQGLITDQEPTGDQLDWAMGYAICDACSKQDPQIQRWRGFSQQVHSAAAQFRDYFDNAKNYNIQVGQPVLIDNTTIIPETQATANLYIYTPHLQGNKNFAFIWNDWFGPGSTPPLPYPEGSLLQLPNDDTVWYIRGGHRKPIISKAVLLSRFDPKKIITVSKENLEIYETGALVKFPQYSIIRDDENYLYLIINDKKRKFESEEVFQKIGYNPEEIIDATSSDLSSYLTDIPITKHTLNPTGKLMQIIETGGVFYVESGMKYPLIDRLFLKLYFQDILIEKVKDSILQNYLTREPYKLRDGELVRTATDENTLFVISEGKRRPFISSEIFNTLGYKKKNVVVVNDRVMDIHPLGKPITGNTE